MIYKCNLIDTTNIQTVYWQESNIVQAQYGWIVLTVYHKYHNKIEVALETEHHLKSAALLTMTVLSYTLASVNRIGPEQNISFFKINIMFRQAVVSIEMRNLLICFCSYDLSCPVLEKDSFIDNLDILLSY